ncbi:hypothetical protein T11_898 [Trichinella zimbabwensis]|uniref:Uncharacterized protein n=1 Tax=Trichinella zimbabwensis TaxID=268475 RepID=A0A0V1HSN5_9BILA|nr:hypothetical protein T11_898 [Trichinella zimbabwensis]
MKDNRKTSDSNPEKAALENNQLTGTEMKHQPNEGGHEEAKSVSGEAGFPEAPRSTNEKVHEEPLSNEADNPRSRDVEEEKSSSRKVGDVEAPNSSEKTAFQQSSSITGEGTSSISEFNSESALEDARMIKAQSSTKENLFEQASSITAVDHGSKGLEEANSASSEDQIMEVKSLSEETATKQLTSLRNKYSCCDQTLEIDLKEFAFYDVFDRVCKEIYGKAPSFDADGEKSNQDSETCTAMGDTDDFIRRRNAGDKIATKQSHSFSTYDFLKDEVPGKTSTLGAHRKRSKNDKQTKAVSGKVGICEKKHRDHHHYVGAGDIWRQNDEFYYVFTAIVLFIASFVMPAWAVFVVFYVFYLMCTYLLPMQVGHFEQ